MSFYFATALASRFGTSRFAPVHRASLPLSMSILAYEDVLNDSALKQVPDFFAHLPVIQRARWRWVFEEPYGSLSYPRQRARREIEAAAAAAGNDARLIDLDSSDQAPHEKISPVFKVSASAGEEWAATCLVTTNKLLDKVPKPPPENSMLTSSKIWLSMIDRTHSVGLLRGSTGLNAIKEWADTATTKQRSALSQLLLSLADHMTAQRGDTTSKIAYGPKTAAYNPPIFPMATLGRPSDSPIVSASQKLLEERLKELDRKAIEHGRYVIERLKDPIFKAELEASKKLSSNAQQSNILSNSALAVPIETTSQAMQKMVREAAASGFALPKSTPSPTANLPASCFNRAIGMPDWHGDAKYTECYPPATKAFPELWSSPALYTTRAPLAGKLTHLMNPPMVR